MAQEGEEVYELDVNGQIQHNLVLAHQRDRLQGIREGELREFDIGIHVYETGEIDVQLNVTATCVSVQTKDKVSAEFEIDHPKFRVVAGSKFKLRLPMASTPRSPHYILDIRPMGAHLNSQIVRLGTYQVTAGRPDPFNVYHWALFQERGMHLKLEEEFLKIGVPIALVTSVDVQEGGDVPTTRSGVTSRAFGTMLTSIIREVYAASRHLMVADDGESMAAMYRQLDAAFLSVWESNADMLALHSVNARQGSVDAFQARLMSGPQLDSNTRRDFVQGLCKTKSPVKKLQPKDSPAPTPPAPKGSKKG